MESKSESSRTRTVAKTSLKTFDMFCEKQGHTRDEVIGQYQIWFNLKPNPDEFVRPDIESICQSLDKFVRFLGKEHKFADVGYAKRKVSRQLDYTLALSSHILKSVIG